MKLRLKRIGILWMVVILLSTSFNWKIQAEEEEPNYEDLFGQAMDIIMGGYYGEGEISKQSLFEAAMKGMFDSLDPYSKFMTLEESGLFTQSITPTNYVGIGIRMQAFGSKKVIVQVFEGSPAQKAGVQPGDIFKAVNGEDVTKMDVTTLASKVMGTEGTSVKITFLRGMGEYTVTITRAPLKAMSVTSQDIDSIMPGLTEEQSSQMAYIKIDSFSSTVDKEFEAFYNKAVDQGVKYLILDLRDNSGGYVNSAVKLANYIIPKGPIVQFRNKNQDEVIFEAQNEIVPFRIYALVNENSASATEFVAGAIQDSGIGYLIGETTYGKGVAQQMMPFTNDYYIKLTIEEFFTRDNHKVNGLGVVPDYEVVVPDFMPKETKYFRHDVSEGVQQLEEVLNYLGYNVGTPDTQYDQKTFDAVKSFQKDAGGYPYGTCDYWTQDALNYAIFTEKFTNDIQLEKAVSLILSDIAEK